MCGFTQNRQIGTALPFAVMNRIRRTERSLFARLRSDCRSRSAISSGGAQTHQAAAGDREDGCLAFVTRYLGRQRQCATYLNTAVAGG